MIRTKIVATIGPASSKKSMIHSLVRSGVSVFRLNFSHGSHREHLSAIKAIRSISGTLNHSVGIIADLQGPKIRTGLFKEKVALLKRGRTVTITTEKTTGDETLIAVDYHALPQVVKKGMTILLSEGTIKLKVISKNKKRIRCRVVRGGVIGEHKGVNVIGIKLASAFTAKDKRDITFALRHNIDYFALSFVRNVDDVLTIKRFIKSKGGGVPLIAKIEKPEAVRNLKSILPEVAGVMVARGDLGVEGDLESVPIWQKKIIQKAHRQGKFVITATQMLESMISMPMPTRAEVTDVANAIFDGTGAVMLSGETAVGKYPLQVIKTMRRIISKAEKSNLSHYHIDSFHTAIDSRTYSIAHAAIDAAHEANVKGIIALTISGETVTFISKRRPEAPIFAFTPHEEVYRRMSIYWGVTPLKTAVGKDVDAVIDRAVSMLMKNKLLKKGDRVVVVFGPRGATGGTDRMKIMTLGINE